MATSMDNMDQYEHSSMESHAISSQAAYAAGKRRLRALPHRRSASASELFRTTDDDSPTDGLDASLARFSRPQSVNFHPDIRLFYAATANDLEEVEMLVESGMASVNARNPGEGATPLHAACFEGHYKCVRYLLEHGARVTACDDDGWTPLHAATCGRNHRCVKLLLTADSNPFAESCDGYTPFQMAVDNRDEKLIDMFFKSFEPLLENKFIPETAV